MNQLGVSYYNCPVYSCITVSMLSVNPLGRGGGGGIGMLSSSFVVGGHIHQGNELGVGVGGRLDHEVQGEMPVVYPVCNV